MDLFQPWQLAAAFGLDLILGDPQWLPHPVRWIGRLIGRLDAALGDPTLPPAAQRLRGLGLWCAVLTAVTGAVGLALILAAAAGAIWHQLVAITLAYTSLSVRSLHLESRRVIEALEADDLSRARTALAMIVSRDTTDLEPPDILRAVLETVAENITDGITAPLFFCALGGPIAALGFKAVNTMDSMIGYENPRYRYFGWFAARADDAANWVPARLTGLLITASAGLSGLDSRRAWRTLRRDAAKMKSPNAGYSEAAAAGALGIQLGGVNRYFGQPVEKPRLGDPLREPDPTTYRRLIRLLYLTSLLALLAALAVRLVIVHL